MKRAKDLQVGGRVSLTNQLDPSAGAEWYTVCSPPRPIYLEGATEAHTQFAVAGKYPGPPRLWTTRPADEWVTVEGDEDRPDGPVAVPPMPAVTSEGQ